MVSRRAKRREAKALADHMIENQVEPQLAAQRLRKQGVDIDVAFADLRPDAKGWKVTCIDCGDTATLPFDPGAKVAMCPRCMRKNEMGP